MKQLGIALGIALAFLAGTGCKRSQVGAKTALQVQLWAEPASLDPAYAEDGVALRVLGNVMDGLVGVDSQGKIEPRLAASWTVSADGLKYSFQLRPEAAWSDGIPVLASHFVDALHRGRDPKTGANFAELLQPIRDVRAEASDRLVIELSRPAPYFLGVLAHPIAVPVRPELTNGKPWGGSTPSTGPYKIGYHRIDDSILLSPNEYYWGSRIPGKAVSRPVMMRIVPDEATAMRLFETGKLDILVRFPALEAERLRKMGRIQVDPFLATYYLAFNTKKAPFTDRQVRRAVSAAIDRVGLVKVLGMGEQPARSWISPGLEGFMPGSDPSAVLADATRAMKGKKLPPFEIGFDSTSRNSLILEKVQADLKARLGVDVRLEGRDWKSHLKRIATDTPAVYRMGWQATFLDPLPSLQLFTSRSPNQFTGWSSPEYDRLVDRIAGLAPGTERAALVRKAQEILVDREAVIAPLFHYVQAHALSPRITRFQVDPFGVIRLQEVEVGVPPQR